MTSWCRLSRSWPYR